MPKITRNLRDGVLTVFDQGANSAATLTLDEGDLTWTEVQNVIEVLDRGTLDHIRKGDEAAMDVSFSIKFHDFYTPSAGDDGFYPYEAIKGVNQCSNWTSTRNEDVYCVSLEFQIWNDDDTAVIETIKFFDFYWTSIEFSEGDEYNTLSVSGRSFATEPEISS